MDKEKLIAILEDTLIDSSFKANEIEEILHQVNQIKNDPEKYEDFNDQTEILLKANLDKVVDWRKRAAIAAAIISYNLEN